jgi:hypothetical protein
MNQKGSFPLDYWLKRQCKWPKTVRLALLWIVIAFAIWIYVHRTRIGQWCEVSYLAFRCETYQAPPRTVAYYKSSSKVPITLGFEFEGLLGADSPNHAPDLFIHVVPCWQSFVCQLNPNAKPEGTIFLHERTSPGGHKRLVAVGVQYLPEIICTVVKYGEGLKLPTISYRGLVLSDYYTPQTILKALILKPGIRIYVGSIDYENTSHFAIPCEMAGKAAILDGWLDDKNFVTIKVRKPDELNAYLTRAAKSSEHGSGPE